MLLAAVAKSSDTIEQDKAADSMSAHKHDYSDNPFQRIHASDFTQGLSEMIKLHLQPGTKNPTHGMP